MKTCAVCDGKFEAKTSRAKYCGQRCKDKGKPSANTLACFICGEPMAQGRTSAAHGRTAHNRCRSSAKLIHTHGATGYRRGCRCDECGQGQADYIRAYVESVKAEQGLHPNTLRRKRFKEAHGYWPQIGGSSWIAPTLRHDLYERDNWTCQICDKPVDMEADRNTNYAPSLDHIVPQSHMLLPDHSPRNLRTVHRLCNSKRGNTADVYGEAQQCKA